MMNWWKDSSREKQMTKKLTRHELKANILADIDRRRKLWLALSELWVLHSGGESPYGCRILLPEGITEEEGHPIIAHEVIKMIEPLGYTAEEIRQIFIYEVNMAMFGIYIPLGIHVTNLIMIELEGFSIEFIEDIIMLVLKRPFYAGRARLWYRLFGNRWPVGPRWRYLQQLLQDRDQQAKESSEQD